MQLKSFIKKRCKIPRTIKTQKTHLGIKSLNGRYKFKRYDANEDNHKIYHWLKNAGLKTELKAFKTVAQDQSLFTNN